MSTTNQSGPEHIEHESGLGAEDDHESPEDSDSGSEEQPQLSWHQLSPVVQDLVVSRLHVMLAEVRVERAEDLVKSMVCQQVMRTTAVQAIQATPNSDSGTKEFAQAMAVVSENMIGGMAADTQILDQALCAAITQLTRPETAPVSHQTDGAPEWALLCEELSLDPVYAKPQDVLAMVQRLKARHG